MSNSKKLITRRSFLKASITGIATLPVMPLALNTAFAAERLSEDNPQAQALHYRHNAADATHSAYQEGRSCLNCRLYTDRTAQEWGPCAVFPNKLVSAKGWCNAWVAVS